MYAVIGTGLCRDLVGVMYHGIRFVFHASVVGNVVNCCNGGSYWHDY